MTSQYFKQRLHEGLAERFMELDYVNIVYYIGGWQGTPRLLQAQVGRTTDDLILESGAQMQEFTRDYFIFTCHLPTIPREGDIILDQNYQSLYSRIGGRSASTHYRFTNETNRRMRVHTSVQQHTAPDLSQGYVLWLSSTLQLLSDEQILTLNKLSQEELARYLKVLAQ